MENEMNIYLETLATITRQLQSVQRQMGTLRRSIAAEDEGEWQDDSLSQLTTARSFANYAEGSMEDVAKSIRKEMEKTNGRHNESES